jgi:SAM-dependent methyltransferase
MNEHADSADVFDRFARFYDGDYRNYQDDVLAILDLAHEVGGPVLELGCGTGRILLPLAEAGLEATGVDLSPALLELARAKLAAAALSRQVTLAQADLRTFDLAQKEFGLAVCTSNTLMHLTTPAGQMAALRNAYRHLRREGLLLIDLFNPDIPRLLAVQGVIELADRWRDAQSGAEIIKWSVRSLDLAAQLQETLFLYEELFDDGRVQRTACPFTLRFLWRNEAELMLQQAGFVVEGVWGDFDGGPYDNGSDHLILLALKR